MNINGKEVSLRFGMLAVEVFYSDVDKYEDSGSYGTYAMARIIYAGMVNFYDVKQAKRPVTFEDIYEWVEGKSMEGDMAEIGEVVNEFSNSQALKKKTEQILNLLEMAKQTQTISDELPTPQG